MASVIAAHFALQAARLRYTQGLHNFHWVPWNFAHLKGRNAPPVSAAFGAVARYRVRVELVELYQTLREVIDMRSFSNLWFWIVLAVLWSSNSHWVLGVPYDMVMRARRHGGEAVADMETIVGINTRRILGIVDMAGYWILASFTFILSVLLTLSIFYGVEFAQAVTCLFFPMLFVGLLSIRTARRITSENLSGDALMRRLHIHRLMVQGIGIVSIFITSMFGMWVNLRVGPW
jgi:hypothetical protein